MREWTNSTTIAITHYLVLLVCGVLPQIWYYTDNKLFLFLPIGAYSVLLLICYALYGKSSFNVGESKICFYSLIWIALYSYLSYLDHIWLPFNLEGIMCYAISGDELYREIPDTRILLLLLSFPIFILISFSRKKRQRTFYISFLSGLSVITLIPFLLSPLPLKRKVYLNCFEPIENPIETVEAKIIEKCHPIRTRSVSKDYILTFEYKYEGRIKTLDWHIESRSDYYRFAEDVSKGMTATLKLQKGARGLPILCNVAVPEAGRVLYLMGDAYNSLSYKYFDRGEINKALETIDKAIAIEPDVANYYDSKGEFLYRKGDKAGAMKMWEKVISLDPDFPKKQNSQLYHYLYGK